VVLHLFGKTHQQVFTGFSIAAEDGRETTRRPPKPEEWDYAKTFYRVPVSNYEPFATPIKLDDVFAQQDAPLRNYFRRNKARPKEEKERLFFVVQAGRLQCLNGAYLSEVSDELASIVLGPDFSGAGNRRRPAAISAATGEQIGKMRARVGQDKFSENVCNNYGNRCCFPDCDIDDATFLIGAHIARWADAPQLRGETANGLCLCLMHDRAFESGLFTLTADGHIWVNAARASKTSWARTHLAPFHKKPIRPGEITFRADALRLHWERIKCTPGVEREGKPQ